MSKATLLTVSLLSLLVILGIMRSSTGKITVFAQETTLTQKQKEHSKLYKQYKRDQKLTALAATATDDVAVTEGIPQKIYRPDSPRFDSHGFINRLGCNADAVVVGVIKTKSPQLTEDESFVFTDYEMLVEDVLKDNPTAYIQPNTHITVSRAGGTIRINGRNVTALDEALNPLEIDGRYLLFLRLIPATGAYEASIGAGSFQLTQKRTAKLTQESLPPELESGRNPTTFIADIRAAITGTCK